MERAGDIRVQAAQHAIAEPLELRGAQPVRRPQRVLMPRAREGLVDDLVPRADRPQAELPVLASILDLIREPAERENASRGTDRLPLSIHMNVGAEPMRIASNRASHHSATEWAISMSVTGRGQYGPITAMALSAAARWRAR